MASRSGCLRTQPTPRTGDVVGIATDMGNDRYRTFDAVLVEGEEWTDEMESLAREIQADLGVSGEGTIHRIREMAQAATVPKHAANDERRSRRHDAGKIGRNDRCPCGSGKKFKHCCLS